MLTSTPATNIVHCVTQCVTSMIAMMSISW